ncbi:hypothetical protein N7445_008309 [Penicillium cf. griseofulvum]|nr:hypothetical protein N7445_008309 [Penicillium cf. griseofulvum]
MTTEPSSFLSYLLPTGSDVRLDALFLIFVLFKCDTAEKHKITTIRLQCVTSSTSLRLDKFCRDLSPESANSLRVLAGYDQQISIKLSDRDLPDFGCLYFDGHVAAKWDPYSPLTKEQQKRSLVESWTRLGKYGRNEYIDEDILWPINGHPSYIPQDLLSEKDHKVDGQISLTLWIRTWFGKKADQGSHDAADEAYKRLVIAAMWDGDETGFRYAIEPEFVFDMKEELGHNIYTTSDENGDANPDVVDGIALGKPGSVPSSLIKALIHCPGQLDGNSNPKYNKWRQFSPGQIEAELPLDDKSQSLMVCVADRMACDEGWVLFLLSIIVIRDMASWVMQYEANWMDGQALEENTFNPDDDVECMMHDGDGWGPL